MRLAHLLTIVALLASVLVPKPALASWVHLQRHEAEDTTASFLAAELSATGAHAPRLGKPLDVPALPHPHWSAHFTTRAAGDGRALAIARPGTAGAKGAVVVWRAQADATPKEVTLDEFPAALLLRGTSLFVGMKTRVGLVDLTAERPAMTVLHTREEARHKAYDLFVSDAERFVAVDDVVQPYLADLFSHRPGGSPAHLAAWELPGIINGGYDLGALIGQKLVLVAHYGILSGSGQDLVALTIGPDQKLPPGGDFILNSPHGPGPVVLEEHEPRSHVSERTLLAGDKVTMWTGLAVPAAAGDRREVALAATGRGVMLVPFPFEAGTKGRLVDVGGSCTDIRAVDDALYGLVTSEGAKKSRLVLLRREADGWKKKADYPLPALYHRFVN